ncbi:unnamed protein product [Laminaria digitata]
MDDPPLPTCLAGLQAMGTLLGTMCGFVSAALLTPHPSHGESTGGLPAAPGVIVGASFGVLAAHSAGEGSQTLRQLVCLLAVSVGAAAATTAVSNWLVGDVLKQGGTVGIIVLAAAASLGPTAVFTVHNHNMLLRRAAAFDDRGFPPHARTELDDPEINPKEV